MSGTVIVLLALALVLGASGIAARSPASHRGLGTKGSVSASRVEFSWCSVQSLAARMDDRSVSAETAPIETRPGQQTESSRSDAHDRPATCSSLLFAPSGRRPITRTG